LKRLDPSKAYPCQNMINDMLTYREILWTRISFGQELNLEIILPYRAKVVPFESDDGAYIKFMARSLIEIKGLLLEVGEVVHFNFPRRAWQNMLNELPRCYKEKIKSSAGHNLLLGFKKKDKSNITVISLDLSKPTMEDRELVKDNYFGEAF